MRKKNSESPTDPELVKATDEILEFPKNESLGVRFK